MAGKSLDVDSRDAGPVAVTNSWRPDSAALRNSNLEQTALAEASLQLAVDITLNSMGIPTRSDSSLPFAVLGLGRLGHSGMDYGSDLDLLMVFDDHSDWPPSSLNANELTLPASPQEFYASLTTQLVRVLSSVTREGFLYRIDLRLRPDGQSGPAAQGLTSLSTYLRDRASAWEHSAYLKVREVAGDLALGARAREAICQASFESAGKNPSLKEELAHVRARLEREKARGNQRDIKWGPGGMTDVYFITRYLQLRHHVIFPTDKGTTALISHLGEAGYLESSQARVLLDGYGYLRRLDHWIRLLLDRPSPILPSSDVALADIARAMSLKSTAELEQEYTHYTAAIRDLFSSVFSI
jgi:glutamate-ammonia-ligase adenylyltransferase